MSGRGGITSSGAAEALEEALVAGHDAGNRRGLWSGVPDVALEGASEKDPIGPREHVAEVAERGVSHLRLRLEDGELPADRLQLLIAEQLARAEAGAVEDQLLRQRGNVGGRGEAPHLDPPSGDLNVADHLTKITAGLDVHRVVAPRLGPGKRVLGPAEHAVHRREVRYLLRLGLARLDIGGKPADAVVVADHDLKPAPAVIERAAELRHELGRDRILAEQPERVELPAGDVGCRVRRKRGGVYGHGKARLL